MGKTEASRAARYEQHHCPSIDYLLLGLHCFGVYTCRLQTILPSLQVL